MTTGTAGRRSSGGPDEPKTSEKAPAVSALAGASLPARLWLRGLENGLDRLNTGS
jgi:hypothetical protein